MTRHFGPRRAAWVDLDVDAAPLSREDLRAFEQLDAVYRALCAMLYNYAPLSGHPGGSISSGRFVSVLLFDTMAYDVSAPDRQEADVLSCAAGHKALGLYAMWALRNEIVRISAPELLPPLAAQLRLEDLLGFRRNPASAAPLFERFSARALDGHPTPATPFVPLATGASGVGMGSSLGLALAIHDWFGTGGPRVHVVEGEGGLTPGRVSEALAFAGTTSLPNVIVHVDWNQSSIDSDRVTREGKEPGDYVQWDPMELFHLHDWNVIQVPDGTELQAITAAQQAALQLDNGQPTAIVYRTTKGWRYGIEGRASHGAGHKLCSKGFFDSLPVPEHVRAGIPLCDPLGGPCREGSDVEAVERCFWDALLALRRWMESEPETTAILGRRLLAARERFDRARHVPRPAAPAVEDVYALSRIGSLPRELELRPGIETTLRAQLGKAISFLNRYSGGALFVAAADLLGSTSIIEGNREFAGGFYHAASNTDSRALAVGGICEDAMSAVLSGISSFGRHIGVGASYGAFLAPLGHIAARLHAIGNQARHERLGTAAGPMILICGHAGLKTGEDGPTHADPQPLQILQENFPRGSMITLTPWEAGEIWYLLSAALSHRPSVIAPFVTRPSETVLDREALALAPARDAVHGVYLLRKSRARPDATIVLQESAVAHAFITEALPLLDAEGVDVEVFYVASAELFDLLPKSERDRIFPEEKAMRAIGITGFTLPTLYRWIRSDAGRTMSMHPFMFGHYTGSGSGRAVLAEAGLDGASQFRRILDFIGTRVTA
ncbi:MAG TPA: hypothetical protein VNA04_17335 [Thermoanaerobaculia bacterium]|nr:hypothetical protein [Thermoanaerobaculia bacterium]